MEKSTVVVKKYGNRRLYDTSRSKYINLEEIAEMVRNGTDLQVVDAVTGEDLTQVTLTQIIVEHAKEEPKSIPTELLRELIVVSDHVGREFISWYLKSAFDAYEKVQSSLKTRISEAKTAATSPLELLNKFLPKEMMPKTEQAESQELLELRARIAELERAVQTSAQSKSKPARKTTKKHANKRIKPNLKAKAKSSGA